MTVHRYYPSLMTCAVCGSRDVWADFGDDDDGLTCIFGCEKCKRLDDARIVGGYPPLYGYSPGQEALGLVPEIEAAQAARKKGDAK